MSNWVGIQPEDIDEPESCSAEITALMPFNWIERLMRLPDPSPDEIAERMRLEGEAKPLPEYALAASVSGPYLRRLYEIARVELHEDADATALLARMMDIVERELLASKQDGEEC